MSTISGCGVPGNIDVMRLLLCYSILLKILTGRASCCSGEIDLVVMSLIFSQPILGFLGIAGDLLLHTSKVRSTRLGLEGGEISQALQTILKISLEKLIP